MFKFVALCALFAVAAAEPGLLASPLAYSSIAPLAYKTIAAPATYINQFGGYIAPSVYSTPFGYSHLIKKRSAPIAYSGYIAPTTYVASAPLATTYSAPIVSPYYPVNSHIAYSTAAHFIKKRSAPLAIPATYIAPTTYAASTPYLTTAYSSPLYTTPYVSATPFGYTQFIKK